MSTRARIGNGDGRSLRGVLAGIALAACLACSADDASSPVNPQTPSTDDSANGDSDEPGDVQNDGAALPQDDASGNGPREDGTEPAAFDPAQDADDPQGAGDPDPPDDVADLAPPRCERSLTEANKATVATAIDELFVQGDISAVDRYWGEPYLQHNPGVASGVETFRNLFGGLVSPGNPIYQLSRIVGQCELVLIHGNYLGFGGPTFDMFRVREGRLVEHWDSTASGAGPNASGRTALGGDATVRDIERSGDSEALVRAFVAEVLEGGGHDAIGDYVSPDLIEHDPESSDGSGTFVSRLQARNVTYREMHHVIGDGNFAFVLSEGSLDATEVAHYDLFRVEGSLIVEHWNARRTVPASTQSGLGIF